MSAFLLGLAFLPALGLLVLIAAALFSRTNTTWIKCPCGHVWHPSCEGWTTTGERIRLRLHDQTAEHRAYLATHRPEESRDE